MQCKKNGLINFFLRDGDRFNKRLHEKNIEYDYGT